MTILSNKLSIEEPTKYSGLSLSLLKDAYKNGFKIPDVTGFKEGVTGFQNFTKIITVIFRVQSRLCDLVKQAEVSYDDKMH